MSNSLIAFMLAIGLTVWIYSKLMRQTGGNTKSAVTASAIIGVVVFLFTWLILQSLTRN